MGTHSAREWLTFQWGIFQWLVILALTFAGCTEPDSYQEPEREPLVGVWRAVLASPGGELPFTVEIRRSGEDLVGEVVNGEERVPLSSVSLDGSKVRLNFDWYDSEIEARLVSRGSRLEGRWRKTVPNGDSTLDFTALRDDRGRFSPRSAFEGDPPPNPELATVEGIWAVTFADEDGSEPARGEFRQEGSRLRGTFLTPTGDYRYLAGSYEEGLLRLSTFDGAHAFLFTARAQSDGTLEGDFWSRDTYHATWTAHLADTEDDMAEGDSTEGDSTAEPLPDAWELVGLTNDEGRFSFEFPDLEGNLLSSEDPRFDGKVVVINVFGSWCPNCNDEAPLLGDWHRRFRDDGLEIVGLAYEFSGDPERDRVFVGRFAERYELEYPMLLAGTSDKKKAAETLPDLSAVVAFPTTIFLDRTGKVRKIHSGFSGPGTGRHYGQLVADLEGLLRELLAEPAPAAAG